MHFTFTWVNPFDLHNDPYAMGTIIIPILHMRKVRSHSCSVVELGLSPSHSNFPVYAPSSGAASFFTGDGAFSIFNCLRWGCPGLSKGVDSRSPRTSCLNSPSYGAPSTFCGHGSSVHDLICYIALEVGAIPTLQMCTWRPRGV